jgi:L-ribulose-5-phosphate 3-epimerase
MPDSTSRRDFMKATLAGGIGVGCARTSSAVAPLGTPVDAADSRASTSPLPIKKAVLLGMLPKKMSYADRFKLARDVGFEAVEAYTTPDQGEAEEIKKAADDARVRIHSVMNEGHWQWPLSSSDPAVVEKSLNAVRTSLHNAKFWGADTVLLVPGVVNPSTRYQDAWVRSQQQIRKLVPLAQELGVVIAVEEVWNKFLLSPLEMAKYVDEFNSQWLKSYFDVGNVVLYGYPQDWILTLGNRVVKVHLKDFKRKEDCYAWVNLGDGDIDWTAVRQAFGEISYSGYATTELEGGDEAYLRDVSNRVDRLVLGR